MRIGVDFDSTLCERGGFPRQADWEGCLPMNDAVGAINYLAKKFDVYVFTSRKEKEWGEIRKWLKQWGFPKLNITNCKLPETIAYIDDRAIRFTNWLDISKYFT